MVSSQSYFQCAIPVFEGLLYEPINKRLMTLLYRAAEWHAPAKLRMHTDRTLNCMEIVTSEFGKLMREFRDLSNATFTTYETDREVTSRNRRQAERVVQGLGTSATTPQGRRPKFLNLLTYKFHALGDYVSFIRLFGPTDVYSTQLVSTEDQLVFKMISDVYGQGELAHRVVKKLYGLGNKKKDPRQIGRRLRRVEWARRASDRRGIYTRRRRLQGLQNRIDTMDTRAHHHIGRSDKRKYNVGNFVNILHRNDPAVKVSFGLYNDLHKN
jgi:hypothetical protein